MKSEFFENFCEKTKAKNLIQILLQSTGLAKTCFFYPTHVGFLGFYWVLKKFFVLLNSVFLPIFGLFKNLTSQYV
jgi:hypothetical protein